MPNADANWCDFAMKLLETDNGDISQIKQKYSDFVDRCKALLELWKSTTEEEPRWDRVVTVLRNSNLNEPARQLDKVLINLKEGNSGQLPLREVDHAHQPILQQYLEGKREHCVFLF